MSRHTLLRMTLAISGVLCASSFVVAQDQDKASKAPKISDEHRVMLIRSLHAEHAFAKVDFPQGKKGITIKEGKLSPGTFELGQQIAREGPAAKVGDRVLITDLRFDGNKLVFEFNGGPRKGLKWYQHISISGMGGEVPVAPSDGRSLYAQGSVVTLAFKDYIPDLSADEVKQLLAPVLDFNSVSVAEAYAKQLPPKVAEAIKNHHVLVGMDRDMVQYAMGRPPKRYRDKDEKGQDYEEWIYGTPPEEVQFVRFVGTTVAKLTVMQVNGEKVVKSDPEVELASTQPEAKPEQAAHKIKRPSLLGPGEQTPTGQTAPVQTTGGSQNPDTTPPPHFASNGR